MSKYLSYMPKLDGLRAVAVLMVVVHHFLDELNTSITFKYGAYGVQLFFAISGFLITSILLVQKNSKPSYSKSKMVFGFMLKRALRLFPIYYLLLIILVTFSKFFGLWLGKINTEWYYFVYAQNFLFYKFNFQSTLLNHTWSLAVEEQFYLIWPFLIFYTPRKLELYFLTFIFFVGLISKFYFLNYYTGIGTIKGITFIHFETLGIGALIAYFVHYKNKLVVQALDKHALLLFFSMLTLSVFFTIFKLNQFLLSTFVSFTAAALIVIASSQKQYMFDSILNLKVFNYLGKISYGIYLFHKPIPFFYKFISQKVNFVIDNKLLLFFIYIIITISIAIISWNTIEKFFLKFKHKFDF